MNEAKGMASMIKNLEEIISRNYSPESLARDAAERILATPNGLVFRENVSHATANYVRQAQFEANTDEIRTTAKEMENAGYTAEAAQIRAAANEIDSKLEDTIASLGGDRAVFSNRAAVPQQSNADRLYPKSTTSIEEASVPTGAKIYEYISNAETPLTNDNFTSADSMVLSELAYTGKYMKDADAEYIRKATRENTTVGEYCQTLLDCMEKQMGEGMAVDPNQYQYLKRMTQSARYKNLKLDSSKVIYNGTDFQQIVAVSNDQNTGFIGVSGTFGTPWDWNNNSYFGGTEPSHEEQTTSEEIKRILETYGYTSVYGAGHSQGGRTITTAISLLPPELKALFGKNSIYNLDGPGYTNAYMDKHGSDFDDLQDKIINLRPDGSCVGRIGQSYAGTTVITATSTGDEFSIFHDHPVIGWEIDPETGEIVAPQGYSTKALISDSIQAGVSFVEDALSEDQINQCWQIVMRLTYDDDDPTSMSFENIMNHLDEISIGDAEILLEGAATIVLDAVSKGYGVIEWACDKLDKVSFLIKMIPEYGQAIAIAIKALKYKAKAVQWICGVLTDWLKKRAEERAARMKAARESYMASNPEMEFSYDLLMAAMEHLQNSNNLILKADSSCNGIWSGLRLQKFWETTETDEEGNEYTKKHSDSVLAGIEYIIQLVGAAFNTVVSLVSAAKALWVDITALHNNAYITKGARICSQLAQNGRTVLRSVPLSSNDEIFTVNPGGLSGKSEEGVSIVEKVKQELVKAEEAVTELGNGWKADDYNALRSKYDNYNQMITDAVNGMENAVKLISDVASIYSQFQNHAVEEFQWAAN